MVVTLHDVPAIVAYRSACYGQAHEDQQQFFTLLRGGTPTMATRHKEFASLCRKVMAMKAKVHTERGKPQRPVPEESSVGTVAAPEVKTDEVAVSAEDLAAAV
jgi:hypothetical protein